jgi:hypothetical protein
VIGCAPPDPTLSPEAQAVDFKDRLQALAGKIPALRDILLTEEATKTALVMPFISLLGYDIHDPTEVIPEFVADFAVKEDELEGYHIVKALLRKHVDPVRIVHRDTQSYMGILLDDNNRKPIARLHFNRKQKYVGVFDEHRKEERVPIETVDDIYKLENKLRRVLSFYEREKAEGQIEETSSTDPVTEA